MTVKARLLAGILITIAAPGHPSSRLATVQVTPHVCAFAQDDPPPALAQGTIDDGTYKLCYVSDYDATSGLYRRLIANNSSIEVRAHWPVAQAGGRLAPHACCINEAMPLDAEPPVRDGALYFDFRSRTTRAYAAPPPTFVGKVFERLKSYIEGFVSKPGSLELQKARVTISSSYSEQKFQYEIVNESGVPIALTLPEFVEAWSGDTQLADAVAPLTRTSILDKTSRADRLVLIQGRTVNLTFAHKGLAQRRYARVEASGVDSRSVDLYGTVAIYVPERPTQGH